MKKARREKRTPSDHDLQRYLDAEVHRTRIEKDQARRKVEEELQKLVAKMEASGKLTDEHRLGLGLPPKCWTNTIEDLE